jgi:DNA-directed RNA polymerase subunit RPC12/RpoP
MAKIGGGCPGQNTAFLKDFKTNTVPCSKCGYEVEFFADERKVICPRCKANIFKVNPQVIKYNDGKLTFSGTDKSCLDWCGGCLNKKDYQDIEDNNKRIEEKKEDLEKLIKKVGAGDKLIIDFFIEAFKKSINSPKLIDDKIFDALSEKDPDLFVKARNYYLDFLNG